MTLLEEPEQTGSRTAEPGPPPAGGPVPPRLSDGTDLIGEYEGSGFKEPPSLVRRKDGQVIQLTPLLYAVAAQADGSRDYGAIARAVSEEIGRTVTADNIEFLVDQKLRPLGVLTAADGSEPDLQKPDPLLGLKFKAAVIPGWLSSAVGRLFQPLFLPPVIVAVLGALVASDIWLFFHHGVAQAIRQALYEPTTFLLMFGAVVLAAGFHEIGHATACRYGGATPGKMGCGLYLAWPAFYTDVTDAYRLGRRARLRTDLGGVYFNTVIILATVGAYFATGFEPLLLLVVIEHFEIVHQLLPVVRLDGYYIVADLTGVPDLFTRIKPIFSSMIPGRKPDERVVVLKRWVRVAVTAWVLVVVPLLLAQLLMILIHLPRILGTAWSSAQKQGHAVGKAFASGHALSGVSGAVQIVALALPIVGILLMLVRIAQQGGAWTWEHTKGRPMARGLAVVAGGAVVAALAAAWLPKQNYKPIQRNEKGTMADGVAAIEKLPTRRAPLAAEQRAAHTSTSTAPTGTTTDTSRTSGGSTTASTTTTTVSSRSGASGGTGSVSSTTSTTYRTTTSTTSGTTSTTTATTVAP